MTLSDYRDKISDDLGSTWSVVNPYCLADIGGNVYIQEVIGYLLEFELDCTVTTRLLSKMGDQYQIYIIQDISKK